MKVVKGHESVGFTESAAWWVLFTILQDLPIRWPLLERWRILWNHVDVDLGPIVAHNGDSLKVKSRTATFTVSMMDGYEAKVAITELVTNDPADQLERYLNADAEVEFHTFRAKYHFQSGVIHVRVDEGSSQLVGYFTYQQNPKTIKS